MKINEKLYWKLFENVNNPIEALENLRYEPIIDAFEILRKAKKKKSTIYTFGNGGSHCNASHFAQDLLKTCGIKAVCLSDMIPSVLAYMNDTNVDSMFLYLKNKFLVKNDVVIAFSCSGNSSNISFALDGWRPKILFTGEDGGRCKNIPYLTLIKVPNPNIRIQESCHSVICHAIIEALLDE